MFKPKHSNIILLKMIEDECWSGHYLYLTLIDEEIVLFCPICHTYSKYTNEKYIPDIKEEFYWLFNKQNDVSKDKNLENITKILDYSMVLLNVSEKPAENNTKREREITEGEIYDALRTSNIKQKRQPKR